MTTYNQFCYPNIAIILARQGSKGIPLKNLAQINGKTLLAYTIEAALNSGCFERVFVSTDGELIAEEARKYQDVEIIWRPEELSSDSAGSIGGVLHVCESTGILCGTATLLQATSPFRTAKDIQLAFQLYNSNTKGSVVSACEIDQHPQKCLVQTEKGHYIPFSCFEDMGLPRQALSSVFRPNGAIYINDIQNLFKYQGFFVEPIQLYLMDKIHSLDIDVKDDLLFAEKLFELTDLKNC